MSIICDSCRREISSPEIVFNWSWYRANEQIVDEFLLVHPGDCDSKKLSNHCGPTISEDWNMHTLYRAFSSKIFRTGQDKARIPECPTGNRKLQ